jgi:uncharacterized protein (TIGR00369 family)
MDEKEKHYRDLERMYLAAPINSEIYKPKISVSFQQAEIEIEVVDKFFHSAKAVHGSVYFKLLDDAAFFAANSIVMDCFVLTSSFTSYFTKMVSTGVMKSFGKVVQAGKNQILAESVVYDGEGQEIGRGSGVFMRSNISLDEAWGYK